MKINTIQETFQNNSVLNFKQEININNKIPFLSVLIDTSNIDRFTTSTYKKKKKTLIPAPSISIVNAPSVIKEQSCEPLFLDLNYYLPLKLSSLTNLEI